MKTLLQILSSLASTLTLMSYVFEWQLVESCLLYDCSYQTSILCNIFESMFEMCDRVSQFFALLSPLPCARQHPSYGDWRLRGNIIRTALCWIVWHKMFTVRSTLIWAVLTGLTDLVCHIGTLTLCVEAVAYSCIIVTWWSGSGGIQAWSLTTNWFPSVLWHCWFGHLAGKNRPRNDL